MAYGILKCDTVTFTNAGVDKSVSISGLVQNPTFSGNVTVTGTLSGVTVTGTTANFTSGNFTNISGGTHTITSGVFAAGSAASPSITFTGDLNTGIYSPGADQVAISTNGTGRLFVDSSGRVGIGTSSPGDVLHVKGGSTYAGVIADNSAATGGGAFRAYRNGVQKAIFCVDSWVTGTSSDDAAIYADAGGGIKFYTNNSSTAKAVLTSGGSLGIGTTSPNDRLTVSGGNVGITTPNGTACQLILDQSGQNAFSLEIPASTQRLAIRDLVANSERLAIDSSGRLLVGTSSARSWSGVTPQFQSEGLDVNSASASFAANINSANGSFLSFIKSRGTTLNSNTLVSSGDILGALYFNGADGTSPVQAAVISAQVDGTPGANDMPGRLVFSTTADGASSPTERLRIDSSGRVGIGTSSPSASLSVAATTTSYTATSFNIGEPSISTGRQLYMGYNTTDGVGFIQPVHWGTEYKPLVLCPNGGRVGIGTTAPSYALDVRTTGTSISSSFTSDQSEQYIALKDSGTTIGHVRLGSTSGSMLFFAGNGERGRFDSSGRLLVGTSSSLGNGIAQFRANTDSSTGEGTILLAKGDAATAGQSLGQIKFVNSSGNQAAWITGEADTGWGGAGSADYPGCLVFSTTADGASSPTERMRISQNGSHTLTGGPGSSHTILTNNAERIRWNDNGSYITTLPTTGSGANVHIWTGSAPANLLMLSTSSQRYKTDIEDLDADRSNAVLNFRPVWYRSTCELDRKDWSWYGLIAEEVAEIEPRLIHWTYLDDAYEVNTKEDGTTEKTLKEDAKLVPNGVQYDRLTVLLLDLAQRQEERIAALEAKVAALGTA